MVPKQVSDVADKTEAKAAARTVREDLSTKLAVQAAETAHLRDVLAAQQEQLAAQASDAQMAAEAASAELSAAVERAETAEMQLTAQASEAAAAAEFASAELSAAAEHAETAEMQLVAQAEAAASAEAKLTAAEVQLAEMRPALEEQRATATASAESAEAAKGQLSEARDSAAAADAAHAQAEARSAALEESVTDLERQLAVAAADTNERMVCLRANLDAAKLSADQKAAAAHAAESERDGLIQERKSLQQLSKVHCGAKHESCSSLIALPLNMTSSYGSMRLPLSADPIGCNSGR